MKKGIICDSSPIDQRCGILSPLKHQKRAYFNHTIYYSPNNHFAHSTTICTLKLEQLHPFICFLINYIQYTKRYDKINV